MQEKEIKVTIIIPVYNMETYIEKCLKCVISQTLKKLEILCINDGSRDASYQKIQNWAQRDSRIRVLNFKHQGAAKTRNIAIKAAKGEYLAFMDADDYYPDSKILEKMYIAAVNNGVAIAGGCFSDFDIDGKINVQYENVLAGYIFSDSQVMEYKDYQYDYGYHRFIYHREFLLKYKIEFPILTRYEDPPFMVQAMTLAKNFYAMSDITYCYRMDYRKINWNQKNTFDLLCGLQQNLRWAKKYQLQELERMTIWRITEEYREAILNQFELENKVTQKYKILAEENSDSYAMQHMLSEGMGRIINRKEEELDRMKRSFSYRIGSALTYVPRRIRRCIKRK